MGPPGRHFGAIFGRIFEPILVAFSRLWSSCFSLLLAPFASVLGPESPERSRRNARETLPAPTARRGRAAGEQGHKRLYWIAVWRLSLVLPLLRCCFSWCWRSGSPCSCCSRCSCPSCRACSSRFERASRSTIARFYVGATNRPQSAPRDAQEAARGAKRPPRGAKTALRGAK